MIQYKLQQKMNQLQQADQAEAQQKQAALQQAIQAAQQSPEAQAPAPEQPAAPQPALSQGQQLEALQLQQGLNAMDTGQFAENQPQMMPGMEMEGGLPGAMGGMIPGQGPEMPMMEG
jgi:ribonuclease D